MDKEDDMAARRMAVQLACQLPEDKARALRSLEYAAQLVLFTAGEELPEPKQRTVVQLKPV